jgi:hypothetical protein
MKEMKMPPKLVLRIHSSNSEIDAVVAMSRPFFDPDEKEMPYHYNPNIKVTDGLPRSLLDAYLIHYRGTSDTSLCNRRMKEVDGSAANYILELANHPGFPRSPEVLATFTSEELADLEDKLTPILSAHEQLLANGNVMDNDTKRAVKSAAKTGYYPLLEKAAANVANIMPSVLLFSPSRSVHYVVSCHRDVIQRCPSVACSVFGSPAEQTTPRLRDTSPTTGRLSFACSSDRPTSSLLKKEWEDYMMEIQNSSVR